MNQDTIHRVVPAPQYDVRLYHDSEGRGTLDAGKVIAVVSFHPGFAGPHMAEDNKYYIRAGAHTVPASHFLVEALWARRQVQAPILTSIIRPRMDGKLRVIDLVVVNLTPNPAVDVILDIEPKLGTLESSESHYPLLLPLVDQANPFSMYLTHYGAIEQTLREDVVVSLTYKDIAGNEYNSEKSSLIKSLPPNWRRG
jgi:hypothetical protein